MSGAREVHRRLVDVARAQAIGVAEPIARTALGAAMLRSGIRYEAHVRQQHLNWASIVSTASGLHTRQQRRADAEINERALLAPGRPHRGHGVPAVFWHGPDRLTAPGRPLVVLVNGWTASGLVWPDDLVARIEATSDVVRIDNRGSGYSRTALAPYTIATMADDVADVVRAVGATSATIVGLSMGGMIAQETALRHPRLVERLVLCGTRPPAPAAFPPAAAVLEQMMSSPRAGESLSEYFARTWRSVVGPSFADRLPEVFAELVDRISRRPTPRAGVETQARAISTWHGAHRLARITTPTAVIHGRDDPLIPVGNGMRLAQLIPPATYLELPGVGHIVPFEAPEALLGQLAKLR